MKARNRRCPRSMWTSGNVPSWSRSTLVAPQRRLLMTAAYAARPMKGQRRTQVLAGAENVVGTGALSSEPKSSGMCGAPMTARQRREATVRANYGRRSWCQLTVVDCCCLAAKPPRARQSPTGAVVVVEAARWRTLRIRGGRELPRHRSGFATKGINREVQEKMSRTSIARLPSLSAVSAQMKRACRTEGY